MKDQQILAELVEMSKFLGKPENDFAILGEGNTSAQIDDDFFYVKASGKYLCNADANSFVKVKHKDALALLDEGELSDSDIKKALAASCADPGETLKPSIETSFHAYLLSLPDVNFVGHTHATAVNSLLCNQNAEQIIMGGRLFPDEIVYCGIEPIFMEYFDPGLILGQEIRNKVKGYINKHNTTPKTILIRNHGIIALGKTAHQVEAVTAMYCKVARVLLNATMFGGIHYLDKKEVERIYTRPDEADRLSQFK